MSATQRNRSEPSANVVPAWCMVIAPFAILLGEVIHPSRSSDPLRQVQIVSQHTGSWYFSHLQLFVGVAMTLPAILALQRIVARAAPRLAVVGGGLACVGAGCFAGLLTVGFVVWQMGAAGADQAQMAALFKRLFHAPGFVVPFELVPCCFAVGMVLLAVAISRAGVAPRWAAVAIGAGATGLALIGVGAQWPRSPIFASGLFFAGLWHGRGVRC